MLKELVVNCAPHETRVALLENGTIVEVFIERKDEIDVLAELPGVEKKDIKVNVTPKTLIIEVPKKFFKEIELPDGIKIKSVKEHYKNGVLTVTLKKKEVKKNGKKIEVT